MSDILWQTFNNTYTNSIRKVSFNNYSDKVSFNNYSDKVSFNNYSDKHFWKMIYNIFTQIMKDIWWTNFTFTSQHSLHNIHFTTFTSQHSLHNIHQNLGMILQQTFIHHASHTFNKLSTNFRNKLSDRYFITYFHKSFATNWVTDISSHTFTNLSQQIEWQIFHHILHHNIYFNIHLISTSSSS